MFVARCRIFRARLLHVWSARVSEMTLFCTIPTKVFGAFFTSDHFGVEKPLLIARNLACFGSLLDLLGLPENVPVLVNFWVGLGVTFGPSF